MPEKTNFLFKYILVFTAILSFGSCSKKDQVPASTDASFLNFSFVPERDVTSVGNSDHQIFVRVPDSILSGNGLVARFSLSNGASATVDNIPQLSGHTSNNYENDVQYLVTASDKQTQQKWIVRATNNNYTVPWGLGHFIHQTTSINRTYNWYIDQGTSGNYALVNCGPASVTMAIRWADSSFSKTAQEARQIYHPTGGWWFTTDIDDYLTNNNITHAIISLFNNADSTRDLLIRQLSHQQIIILCLDMDHVRPTNQEDFHVDKFYTTTPGWGHFIVLKGYRNVDGETFFEAYDPYSFGYVNSDYSLKGQNRYYRYEDLAEACLPWWNFALVIASKGENLNTEAIRKKLDPSRVPVAHNF